MFHMLRSLFWFEQTSSSTVRIVKERIVSEHTPDSSRAKPYVKRIEFNFQALMDRLVKTKSWIKCDASICISGAECRSFSLPISDKKKMSRKSRN